MIVILSGQPGFVTVFVACWQSIDCMFDSQPFHHLVTTLVRLFSHMCLLSPSSIIWYQP